MIQFFALEGVLKLPSKGLSVAQLRHLLNVPIVVCTGKWKGQKAGLYKHWRPIHMCDLDVVSSNKAKN